MSELAPPTLIAATLMHRLSDEIQRCRMVLARIEHTIHPVPEDAGAEAGRQPLHADLQDIDLLDQKLCDLATCMVTLGQDPAIMAASGISEARVLGSLKLDDVRRRLRGTPQDQNGVKRIELF
jgi:hypothetical protein